ncbi:acetate kinase [Ilyomonas limi]|uniref:Acetate kinase n=2 Tax=Ilyomonas limi TaxID=2575867 RepID=A0A4U3L9U6_9BACT|nr:acetate kinase [Ilyomonas limi]
MNIFVINSGSSSIKYQLFQMPSIQPVCTGLIERIGSVNATIKHKTFIGGKEDTAEQTLPLLNHEAGLQQAVDLLTHGANKVIDNLQSIDAVGHRVVHGGEKFASATFITTEVKESIHKLFSLAPLHNPANYTGIEVAEKVFTGAKQIAIFDTAFHQTMPEYAFRYALPTSLYTNDGIRVYGFHGTSHDYVTKQAMQYLQNPAAKLISIHLGNGCSMAAVVGGKCIDTSMGFGPLAGLVMGTRSGDIDPSVIFYLINELHYLPDTVSTLLNKQSGMLGLTGFIDMRDVNKKVENGDKEAEIACKMYAYRIQKYIGAYAAAMNGLDAIIFTAGVGENDSSMRRRICSNMDYLGISIDDERNNVRVNNMLEINKVDATTKVLVIPTNEELEIAKQCFELLGGS